MYEIENRPFSQYRWWVNGYGFMSYASALEYCEDLNMADIR